LDTNTIMFSYVRLVVVMFRYVSSIWNKSLGLVSGGYYWLCLVSFRYVWLGLVKKWLRLVRLSYVLYDRLVLVKFRCLPTFS
jgi:hypothetical protein